MKVPVLVAKNISRRTVFCLVCQFLKVRFISTALSYFSI